MEPQMLLSRLVAVYVSVGLVALPAVAIRLPTVARDFQFGAVPGELSSIGRQLAQSELLDVPEQVTVVKTALGLQTAFERGDAHIEVQDHLYLPDLELSMGTLMAFHDDRSPVKSIRGNCSAAAVSPADFAFQYLGNAKIEEREIGEGSTQCLLIADASFLKTESRIWLDNLYIRMLAPTRQGGSAAPRSSGVVAEGQSQDIRKFTFMTVTGDEAALYMTSVTLQGDGGGNLDCKNCAVELRNGASLYAQGSMFADFDAQAIIFAEGGTTVSLVGCRFEGNTLFEAPGISGLIVARFPKDTETRNSSAHVRLEDTSFNSTLPEEFNALLADFRGNTSATEPVFYSNVEVKVCELQGEEEKEFPECAPDATTTGIDQAPSVFLTTEDSWFASAREEASTLPKTESAPAATSTDTAATSISPTDAAPTISASEADDGQKGPKKPPPLMPVPSRRRNNKLGVGAIVGISLGAVALLVLALAGAFCIGTKFYFLGRHVDKDDGSVTTTSGAQYQRHLNTSDRSAAAMGLMRTHTEPSDTLCGDGRKQEHPVGREGFSPNLPEPSREILPCHPDASTDTASGTHSIPGGRDSAYHKSELESRYSVNRNPVAKSDMDSLVPVPLDTSVSLITTPPVQADWDYAQQQLSGRSAADKGNSHRYYLPPTQASGYVPSDPFGTINRTTQNTESEYTSAVAPRDVNQDEEKEGKSTSGSPVLQQPVASDSDGTTHAVLPVVHAVQRALRTPSDPEGRKGDSLRISLSTMQNQSVLQSMVDEEFVASCVAPELPPSGCTTGQVLEYIKQQLDCFGKEPLLLGKYQLLGPKHRCTGGQGVVQFARRVDGSGTLLYAIKFFAHRSDYAEEAEVYRSSPLRHFMPNVIRMASNEGGAIRDPFGGVLAPFIVMEKGESLQERARNGRVDLFTAAQILGHVSQRISELHQAGYVHRDLKPGNIMWQPRTYTWVLIDFGLAAPIGQSAPFGCTPTFAAPETAQAWQRYARKMVADAKVDAWALGVIAFELLLERPAFGPFVSVKEVYKQLASPDTLLPWEEGRLSAEDKQKLGRFRKPVMDLLHRDPQQRDTAGAFCKKMVEIFSTNPDAASMKDSMPARRFLEQQQTAGRQSIPSAGPHR